MFRSLLHIILVAALVSTTFVAHAGDEGKKTKTLTGRVVDAQTSESLAGVEVTIEGTSIKVFTDFEGNFTVENLAPGSYNIKTSYIAYEELKLRNIKVGDVSSGLELKLHQN